MTKFLLFIAIVVVGIAIITVSIDNYNKSKYSNSTIQDEGPTKARLNRFVLTSCIGKKLVKDAYFSVSGSVWVLDFNNGDKIRYNIISGNSENPLCGISALDSFGENCEICIENKGAYSTVEFDYGNNNKLTYKGFYDK